MIFFNAAKKYSFSLYFAIIESICLSYFRFDWMWNTSNFVDSTCSMGVLSIFISADILGLCSLGDDHFIGFVGFMSIPFSFVQVTVSFTEL